MCGPAALPIAAAVMSVASIGVGAMSANAQAKGQARIAERNATMEREASQVDLQNSRDQALSQYRQIGQTTGAQRARAAAGGVSVDYGTAAQVQADTQLLGNEDVSRIYQQRTQTQMGRDIGASNYEASANASRSAGKAALVKGAFDIGSSLLSSASQYDKMRTSQGKKGLF